MYKVWQDWKKVVHKKQREKNTNNKKKNRKERKKRNRFKKKMSVERGKTQEIVIFNKGAQRDRENNKNGPMSRTKRVKGQPDLGCKRGFSATTPSPAEGHWSVEFRRNFVEIAMKIHPSPEKRFLNRTQPKVSRPQQQPAQLFRLQKRKKKRSHNNRENRTEERAKSECRERDRLDD